MSTPENPALSDPELWSRLSLAEGRAALAAALLSDLADAPGVVDAVVEVGPADRPYDCTAALETDVGVLRTELWSHARATVFADPSIHPANRAALAPARAVREAADRLRRRLDVRFTLESRGLTLTMEPEPNVVRTWTAERARFRNRTAVTREDVVERAAEVDVRDLLAHFYSGPSLRLVGAEGPFLLPSASEAEGPLVSLCRGCNHWSEGAAEACPACGAPVDAVIASRPPRR